MTDRDDLTPPPDQPLPEHARARIRSELLAGAQEGRGSGAQRWWVPAVAAAAVLVVVGVGAWTVGAGDDGAGDGAPAGAPTSSVPDAADWTMGWTDAPEPEPSEPSDKASLNLSTCYDPVTRLLPGARSATTFPPSRDGGETTIWVAGETFALCDVRAGTTTVHEAQSMSATDDIAPYRVSSIYLRTRDGFRLVQVAGGLVPPEAMAFGVGYTFPDGHSEAATTTTDDQGRTWWRVVHAYDVAGPESRPIRVTVRYSGVERAYSLKPGVDTCAQADVPC